MTARIFDRVSLDMLSWRLPERYFQWWKWHHVHWQQREMYVLYWAMLVNIVILLTGCFFWIKRVRNLPLKQDVPTEQFTDLNTIELQDEPIIAVADIVSYDWNTHAIELTVTAYARLQDFFKKSVGVDGEPICILCRKGYTLTHFWSFISLYGCFYGCHFLVREVIGSSFWHAFRLSCL